MTSIALTAAQKDVIVRTVLSEARPGDNAGMQGVANVIKNRATSGNFPSDPAAVALQHDSAGIHQFSAWNTSALGGNNPNKWSTTSTVYKSALAAVDAVFSGSVDDNTLGATFYHTPGTNPTWDNHMTMTTSFGGHLYYSPAPVPPKNVPSVGITAMDMGGELMKLPNFNEHLPGFLEPGQGMVNQNWLSMGADPVSGASNPGPVPLASPVSLSAISRDQLLNPHDPASFKNVSINAPIQSSLNSYPSSASPNLLSWAAPALADNSVDQAFVDWSDSQSKALNTANNDSWSALLAAPGAGAKSYAGPLTPGYTGVVYNTDSGNKDQSRLDPGTGLYFTPPPSTKVGGMDGGQKSSSSGTSAGNDWASAYYQGNIADQAQLRIELNSGSGSDIKPGGNLATGQQFTKIVDSPVQQYELKPVTTKVLINSSGSPDDRDAAHAAASAASYNGGWNLDSMLATGAFNTPQPAPVYGAPQYRTVTTYVKVPVGATAQEIRVAAAAKPVSVAKPAASTTVAGQPTSLFDKILSAFGLGDQHIITAEGLNVSEPGGILSSLFGGSSMGVPKAEGAASVAQQSTTTAAQQKFYNTPTPQSLTEGGFNG